MNQKFINRTELRVIGMSRSGSHAILNWIYCQSPGRVCFLNCVEPNSNPFETARTLAAGQSHRVSYPGFSASSEAAGELSPKDAIIYSYEDCFLGMVGHPEFERNRERFVGRSRKQIDILILRDPFNLFASRLKAGTNGVTPGTAVRIWKQHAREFSGRRRYLPPGRVAISYNRWTVDRDYRREIAARLELEFSDAGFEDVSPTGGGSSFDGVKYDGRASRMNVHQRWTRYAHHAEYRALLDNEVIELSEEIFGPIAGTRDLQFAAPNSTPQGTANYPVRI